MIQEQLGIADLPEPPRSTVLRGIYFVAGLTCVAIGFVGVFLPVLPTTPFLILAAACFARSSSKLERWLLEHPLFGPALRQWRERGAISRKTKAIALAGASAGFVLFWIRVDPDPIVASIVAALMLTGLAYVFTRPS